MSGEVPHYFVENLTLATWLGTIWPRLRHDCSPPIAAPVLVHFVDADSSALALARFMARNLSIRLERFDFDAERMYDESGMLIWLRIFYRDMADALQWVLDAPLFMAQAEKYSDRPHLMCFLRKECLPGVSIALRAGLWRAVYLLHVCLWKMRTDGVSSHPAVLFLDNRPWMAAFARYAAAMGAVSIVASGTGFDFRAYLRRLFGREGRLLLEGMLTIATGKYRLRSGSTMPDGAPPAIALQYYGQFNLDSPERHSDFFYWQQSSLPGRSVIALFGLPQDPLDQARLHALEKHRLRALALRYSATTLPAYVDGETHLLRRAAGAARLLLDWFRHDDARWLRAETLRFEEDKKHWKSLFQRQNIKVFTTWFKYNSDHCVIAEAIREAGGALAVYQRSYEGNATAQTALCTDIQFTFSQDSARIEAEAGSRIDYCVVTGYLGDHRFPLVKDAARQVRENLELNGARFVAAYFDEGAFADARWGITYGRLRAHYGFLLEKVMSEPSFGLVLKPKTPHTLRARLGPLAELLDQARATGRCHIYDAGVLQGEVPPAQAALSADLVIHCSVSAGTAAVEAVLAGVPAVLIDEDGWTISPLYRLEKGRVIFNDLEALWYTWHDHRSLQKGMAGFADWSSLLETLDPFRDGRAAERMGTYLKWLIEGFEAGLPRKVVLDDAAERYCAAWGADKVTAVGRAT